MCGNSLLLVYWVNIKTGARSAMDQENISVNTVNQYYTITPLQFNSVTHVHS